MLTSETKRRLQSCRDLLGGKRSFFTGPLAPYRWRALLPQTVSADERVALFSGGLEAIGNANTGAHLTPRQQPNTEMLATYVLPTSMSMVGFVLMMPNS